MSAPDASATSLLVSVAVVAGFGALALLTPEPLARALLTGWLAGAAGPWSLPAVICAFAAFAFLGVPQLVLVAAAIVAFGPAWGAFDSWVGTLMSALIGFWLGRRLGPDALRRVGGARAAKILQRIGRHGFAASLVVRLLPSVPFLAVNMVAGALPMSALDYAVGTAIGIMPKIALTALASGSLLRLHRDHDAALALVAIAVTWLALALAALLWLRRQRAASDSTPAPAL